MEDKYHYHELLDRCGLIASNGEDFILFHPVTINHKDLNKLANNIMNDISSFYNLAAQYDFSKK